jgi:hypothetical protein
MSARVPVRATSLAILLAAIGCAAPAATHRTVYDPQEVIVRTLRRGMNEQDVINSVSSLSGIPATTGAPLSFRSEVYAAGDDHSGLLGDSHVRPSFKVLFYHTGRARPDADIRAEELPIVFENGRLAGWGWVYWETTASAYHIHRR